MEVFIVNRTEEPDGLYVFRHREDAEAFMDYLDEESAVLTSEPVFSTASELMELTR